MSEGEGEAEAEAENEAEGETETEAEGEARDEAMICSRIPCFLVFPLMLCVCYLCECPPLYPVQCLLVALGSKILVMLSHLERFSP